MNVVLSPYHLTTKEPPALAAVLLSERVVTFIPSPLSGRDAESLGRAVDISPRYLRFMDSWRWSMPLWESGVIGSSLRESDAAPDVRHVCELLSNDERFAPLRPLLHEDLFEDEKRYLDAVSHDLLRGGPDPGVSMPVNAALDRFACRNSMVVMRAHATSVAQRAEERTLTRFFSIAVPAVVQADAPRLKRLRSDLGEPLKELRATIGAAATHAYRDPDAPLDREMLGEIDHAARAYSMEFDSLRDDLLEDAKDDEVRLIDATLTVSMAALPVDSVLRSGLTAIKALTGVLPRANGHATKNATAVAALAKRDPLEGRRVVTMIVKALGRPAASRA